MTVGERIKELRDRLGMSQVDFAYQINVSKQTLYKYENNLITNIPSDKIEAAAKLCNVSPAYIMGWDENNDTQLAYNRFVSDTLFDVFSALGYKPYKLLKIFNSLPKEQQNSMIDNADFMASRYLGNDFHMESEEAMDKMLFSAMGIDVNETDKCAEFPEHRHLVSYLNAAHELNPTDDQKESADNIMTDDSEWE